MGEVIAEINDPQPPKSQDPLGTEFLYYGSVLKTVAPTLSNDSDRALIIPWIKKLFRPEYQTTKLREKRNRYLVILTVNILNDEAYAVFVKPPPDEGPLMDLDRLFFDPVPAAEWELDKMWQETLLSLPDDFQQMQCTVHSSKDECDKDHKFDTILDQEFQFLLYLTRPYAALLAPEDRTRTASWIQTLCTIHGKFCSGMKSVRNDYIMTLLGYLHDLRIVGPFVNYPPQDGLKPLWQAAAECDQPITDPTTPQVNEFLIDQPIPDDGAFCYIALTGDLIASAGP